MAQLLATYTQKGERHRIELLSLRDGKLLLDRAADRSPLVVAELSDEEGEGQALAVLEGGGYLERTRPVSRACAGHSQRTSARAPERRRAA